jgi:hypothetical protein
MTINSTANATPQRMDGAFDVKEERQVAIDDRQRE